MEIRRHVANRRIKRGRRRRSALKVGVGGKRRKCLAEVWEYLERRGCRKRKKNKVKGRIGEKKRGLERGRCGMSPSAAMNKKDEKH